MSHRITSCFKALKEQNKAAFLPYIMGGDPSIDDGLVIMDALANNGADIIEVGFPFSDPTADGPAIQAAGDRALAAGSTLANVLGLCSRFRQNNDSTPIILMGYANPLLQYGYEDAAQAMHDAGIDGIIVVDLPPEEEKEFTQYLEPHDIAMIRLIAPTTQGERLQTLLTGAKGFVYTIAIKGITGTASADQAELKRRISEVRQHTSLPVVTGFGIKNADQAAELNDIADGIVVGSALVEQLYEAHQAGDDLSEVAANFANEVQAVMVRKSGLISKLKRLFG